MQNEGDFLKRFICALLVSVLLPVCAFALDVDGYNTFLSIFGENELNKARAIPVNGMTMFKGDTNVTFTEENGDLKRIIVDGDGVSFLAYSMAAIMMFDPASENYSGNAGQLLSAFLLSRNSGESYGYIATGELFLIQKQEKGYFFTIGK